MSKINLNRKPEDDEFVFSGDSDGITYIVGLQMMQVFMMNILIIWMMGLLKSLFQ